MILLNSQYENSLNCSNEEIERAKKARNLYAMLGYQSIYDFKIMVKNNMLMNCAINEKDIDIAEKIFGPDIHGLKGKTVRKNSVPVVEDYVQVPKEILKLHKNVTLAIDHMYVNGECFLLP